MTFRPELLDELLTDYQDPKDLWGEDGILKRCLDAEMEVHLEAERDQSNRDQPPNRLEAQPENAQGRV